MYSKVWGYCVLEQFGVLNIWTYLAGMFFIIIVPGPNSLYGLKPVHQEELVQVIETALGVLLAMLS